ncbi:MAG: glycogen debranching protein [bacterium]|nr:glycogen debranching protein [bacterium]
MKTPLITLLTFALFFANCTNTSLSEIEEITKDSPNITGKAEYLESPFVTAGNRVYMVGHQNGTFPPLGWHIDGEMGGIWNHPIKLMDGISAALTFDFSDPIMLNNASSFTNYPYANRHDYHLPDKDVEVQQWNYVPDDLEGIIIEYVFKNNSDNKLNFQLEFTAYSDLRPTWLGERTNMIDAADSAELHDDLILFKDIENPWFAAYTSDGTPTSAATYESTHPGKGIAASQTFDLTVDANSSITHRFYISGSYTDKESALETLERLKENPHELLISKRDRYAALQEQTKLTIPDKELQETFEWLKYNSDWLVRTVPEIGSGIGAGIPDYPWWFGVDSEYALQGYMMIGQTKAVYDTIELLDSVSNAVNGNGRIIHEMSTNGAVFNPGNINETPQFATLIWQIYRWNGDREFLERYFPTIEAGLDWLLAENDDNNNLFPDGYGMMEIHGLSSEMIDVASYTQKAFIDAAYMADELGKPDLAASYREKATELAKRINEEFWSEEFASYADFIGTDEQALHLIDDAIIRADTLNKPWAVEELKATRQAILDNPSDKERPFVVHHNWVVNTPMEVGIADPEKALIALETAENFVNPFGMFVTGIDRDESAGSDDGSFQGSKIFSYTGAVMTLPTGVQVVAENNYGRPDQALNYLQRMTRTFSYALPGSMYEVSPDYGMMTQAWNIYSYAVPIISQFFGVQPMASEQTIYLKPQMPSSWDEAKLENVLIGDKTFSLEYSRDGDKEQMRVLQEEPNWRIAFVNEGDTTRFTARISQFNW